jgi:hypothetical protein
MKFNILNTLCVPAQIYLFIEVLIILGMTYQNWNNGDNTLCVGPEAAPIPVTDKYLQGNRFWIKCGNQETYDWFTTQSLRQYPNYFYQPNANVNALTSSNRLWTPGTVPVNDTSIIVLPEIKDRALFSTVQLRCYGVCSTFLTFIKRMRNEGEWY